MNEWKDRETGKPLKSCTMIITEPNDFVIVGHDRMPVLSTERQYGSWLSGEAGLEFLEPAPNDFLQKWPMSKRVNSSRNSILSRLLRCTFDFRNGSSTSVWARSNHFRYCSNRYRIAALQQTADFPSPQTSGYVITGRFENRDETWPS